MTQATLDHYELLCKGVYTPKQAARYARLKTSTLKRWIHGDARYQPAVKAELGSDPDDFVTFLDLIQALAIRQIRLDPQKNVSLQRIRNVIDVAERDFCVRYPFARRHTTYLFDDDIVIRLEDDTLIQITGKYKKNQLIDEVVELFADDLAYNEEGMAYRYTPYQYKGKDIVLDPTIRFGEPIVADTGFTAEVLVNAAHTEGSIENAAKMYGVESIDIQAALRYYDWLLGVAA